VQLQRAPPTPGLTALIDIFLILRRFNYPVPILRALDYVGIRAPGASPAKAVAIFESIITNIRPPKIREVQTLARVFAYYGDYASIYALLRRHTEMGHSLTVSLYDPLIQACDAANRSELSAHIKTWLEGAVQSGIVIDDKTVPIAYDNPISHTVYAEKAISNVP
jgi:hypothetical protein